MSSEKFIKTFEEQRAALLDNMSRERHDCLLADYVLDDVSFLARAYCNPIDEQTDLDTNAVTLISAVLSRDSYAALSDGTRDTMEQDLQDRVVTVLCDMYEVEYEDGVAITDLKCATCGK